LGIIVNDKADDVITTLSHLCYSFADESSIGLLHSSIEERNVGKSLTLDLLAKRQGVASCKHLCWQVVIKINAVHQCKLIVLKVTCVHTDDVRLNTSNTFSSNSYKHTACPCPFVPRHQQNRHSSFQTEHNCPKGEHRHQTTA